MVRKGRIEVSLTSQSEDDSFTPSADEEMVEATEVE